MAGAGEIGVHTFMETIEEERVHFHVLRLKDSFILWIGTELNMKSLSVAMKSRTSDEVISSQLLGPINDIASMAMAQRLAKRTGCQCFVSVSLTNQTLIQGAEAAVLAELESNQSLFYMS